MSANQHLIPMASADPTVLNKQSGSGSRVLLVIVAIVVLSIAAFLILRPNPSGSGGQNRRPSAPASSSK